MKYAILGAFLYWFALLVKLGLTHRERARKTWEVVKNNNEDHGLALTLCGVNVTEESMSKWMKSPTTNCLLLGNPQTEETFDLIWPPSLSESQHVLLLLHQRGHSIQQDTKWTAIQRGRNNIIVNQDIIDDKHHVWVTNMFFKDDVAKVHVTIQVPLLTYKEKWGASGVDIAYAWLNVVAVFIFTVWSTMVVLRKQAEQKEKKEKDPPQRLNDLEDRQRLHAE